MSSLLYFITPKISEKSIISLYLKCIGIYNKIFIERIHTFVLFPLTEDGLV